MIFSLDKSILDKECIIISINNNSKIKERLTDLGFIKGTNIQKVLTSPFGGISAYYLLGTLIALRNIDAKEIMVQYNDL